MVEKVVDCRGRPCPEPVIEVRKVLLTENPERLRVLVDNRAAAENVLRLGRSLGREVRIASEEPGTIDIIMTSKTEIPAGETQAQESSLAQDSAREHRAVILVSSAQFGVGETELGNILMRSFIKTLKEIDPPPRAILFVNSGVLLTTEGSTLLADIEALANRGTRILSCGTCLDYYHLQDRLRVGAVTNMLEIATLLTQPGAVRL